MLARVPGETAQDQQCRPDLKPHDIRENWALICSDLLICKCLEVAAIEACVLVLLVRAHARVCVCMLLQHIVLRVFN